jgi:hypothetical protein
MSQPTSTALPAPQPLSTSSALRSSLDGLPEWCSDAFRERYGSGEVPQFGCYDPVYLRRPLQPALDLSGLPSSPFFPPFSSLVRQYVKERDATSEAGARHAVEDEEGEGQEELAGYAFGRARPPRSWERITSAEDLWNGPPLTTKIPPAADYERILLDRA